MAPELLAARRVPGQLADRRSDLWSLGLVLFQLCTGESFWQACCGISEFGTDAVASIGAKLAALAADQSAVDAALTEFFAGRDLDGSAHPHRQLRAVLDDLWAVTRTAPQRL